MSDYYWNEYIKYYIDEELLRNTLKYHQKTVSKWLIKSKPSDEKIYLMDTKHITVSDVYVESKNIEELGGILGEIIKYIKKKYELLDNKVSFPVLTVLDERMGYGKGVYSIDYDNGKMLKINDDKIEKTFDGDEKFKSIISFFLNIEKALAFYGERGYIQGIEEIGYLCKNIKTRWNEQILEYYIPEQEYTHNIGINVRKCLLIDNIIF